MLGMVGISLFGTCTMKYNPRVSEAAALRPQLAEIHPLQPGTRCRACSRSSMAST